MVINSCQVKKTDYNMHRFCVVGMLDMNLDIRAGGSGSCYGLHLIVMSPLGLVLAVLSLSWLTLFPMFSSLAEFSRPGVLW